MLRIEGLQVKYGDFIAVSSATLEIPAGQIAALIGANGAGKSSLLSAATGLHRPSAGKVFFEGEDITGLPADQVLRRGLCLVPQGGRCFLRMSVRDNLLMGSYPPAARKHAKETMERVYALFPVLRQKAKEPAGTLSGGQRQMVAIGRALMSRPKCLLFDEISLGLAPVVIKDIYARVQEINREQGVTAVLVEQDTERALRMANTCHVMMKGAITLSGEARTLNHEKIKAAYFGI